MNYEDFVMRTMRNQRTPRTTDEAFRTPTYACAITKFYPTHHRTALELRDWGLLAVVVGLFVHTFYLLWKIL